MIRATIAAVVVLTLAASASAYDFLYSGATAITREAGSFGISGSVVFMTADQYYDVDGEAQDGLIPDYYQYKEFDSWDEDAKLAGKWISLRAYYSVLDQVEVGVTPVFIMDTIDHGEVHFEGEPEESEGLGIGDTWAWVKYMFATDPVLALRAAVKIPSGDDEPDKDDELATGSGQFDVDGAIMFAVPAGPGRIDASFGYRLRLKRDVPEEQTRIDALKDLDYKPGDEIRFFAGYTQPLSDAFDLRLAVDGLFGNNWEFPDPQATDGSLLAHEDSGMGVISLNPGVDYKMENGISIGADFHYPLMGANLPAVHTGFGVTLGWEI